MENDPEANTPETKEAKMRSRMPGTLMVICVLCLAAGFLAGYLLRGSAPPPNRDAAATTGVATNRIPAVPHEVNANVPQAPPQMPDKMPTLDDLKRMADKKAGPLLAKLNADKNNSTLENQIGLIYENAHQFKQAAGYFQQALQGDPRNIGVRADYASCLYYTGDVDGALEQLNQSLTYDPKHAGTLMNIGIIKWRGKNDVDGAVAAWEKVLQYHPEFPQKDLLQHMIAQAKLAKKAKNAGEGQKG